MTPNQYQEEALKTLNPELSLDGVLAMCALGLAGESGEVCDALKKHLFHMSGKPLDRVKMAAELGDVAWYLSVLAKTIGCTLEDVMQHNLDKLAARHGTGFTATYASDSGDSL